MQIINGPAEISRNDEAKTQVNASGQQCVGGLLGLMCFIKTKRTWGSAAWAHCCCTCSEILLDSAAKDSGSETRTRMMCCPSSVLLWKDYREENKTHETKQWSNPFTCLMFLLLDCSERQQMFGEFRRSLLNKSLQPLPIATDGWRVSTESVSFC